MKKRGILFILALVIILITCEQVAYCSVIGKQHDVHIRKARSIDPPYDGRSGEKK